jgi:PAT family beta-lactamase induction signal transducer AmpG
MFSRIAARLPVRFRDAVTKKGYSGVAIYSKREPDEVRTALGWAPFDDEGRYIEARFGNLSVVSFYIPSGSSGEERQGFKFEVMEWLARPRPVAGQRPRLRAVRRLEHRAQRAGHQELEIQPEEFRLPAARAGVAQRACRRGRRQRRHAAAGQRKAGLDAYRALHPQGGTTPGGATAVRRGPTSVGASTTSSPPRRSASAQAARSAASRASPTTRRSPWTTPNERCRTPQPTLQGLGRHPPRLRHAVGAGDGRAGLRLGPAVPADRVETLSTRLRDAGLDLGSIGLISLASFFYLLKFLWAPLIDRYRFPLAAWLGRRRSWLLASQVGVGLGLAALAFVRPELGVGSLVAWVLFTSFAGATQDSVVDAYRIEVAPAEAQAALAATYTLGYRVGLIIGGAGALYVADFVSWKAAYLMLAALMLLPLLATLVGREPAGTRQAEARIDVAAAFWRPSPASSADNGWAMGLALLFVGLFKFPDQVIGVMAGPFFLDRASPRPTSPPCPSCSAWVGIRGRSRRCVWPRSASAACCWWPRWRWRCPTWPTADGAEPGQEWAFFAAIGADNLSRASPARCWWRSCLR